MTSKQRIALRQRYQFRCGYCGTSEAATGAELTLDHFQPRSRGGREEPENWVYCCHACNEFKGDFWQPDAPERILHPLNEDLSEHLREESDGTLVGLTDTGRFHIHHLRLNRAPIVARRQEERRSVTLSQTVEQLRDDVRDLRQQLVQVETALRIIQRRTR